MAPFTPYAGLYSCGKEKPIDATLAAERLRPNLGDAPAPTHHPPAPATGAGRRGGPGLPARAGFLCPCRCGPLEHLTVCARGLATSRGRRSGGLL